MIHKHFVQIVLLVALLLSVGGAAFGQDPSAAATVTLSADGLTAPESLPAGWVTLEITNSAEAPFIGVLMRLNDGVTLDDLFTAMAEDPLGMLPLVTLKGGPAVMPGQSGSITFNLDTGSYVLANFAGEAPQIAPIMVEDAADAAAQAPAADLEVVMVDFGYGLPLTVSAGESVWRIENAGQQWHELAIAPVEPGTAIEDLQALLSQGEESSLQQLPVLMPMSGGESVYVNVNLQPGTYAIICNLPDLMNMDEMHTHYELGMIQLVTVTDTVAYTDPAGMFTLEYPADLAAVRPDLARTFGFPFPSVGLADTDETTDLSSAGQPVPEGGWGIGVMVIPEAFLLQMGMPADASLNDLAMVFAPQSDNAEGSEVVSVSEITLADGTAAIETTTAGVTEDGVSIFYEAADGVYVLAALLLSPDGRTDALVDDFMRTVNSIEFTGTVEDLMAGMGGE